MKKGTENKGEIISKLSVTRKTINKILPLKDQTVPSNSNDLLPKTGSSNENENMLPSEGNCLIQQIIKDKHDGANISVSSNLHHLNEHVLRLNFDLVDNNNIKVKHISQKGLHRKPKRKDTLALNIAIKIISFYCLRYMQMCLLSLTFFQVEF